METTKSRINENDMRIIDDITFTLLTLFATYTELSRTNKALGEKLTETLLKIGHSDRNLAFWYLYLNFSNFDDKGVYTDKIKKEIDRFFSVLSSETKHRISKSTRSKIFAEIAKFGIWYPIKTRKSIKDKSPQSLSRMKDTQKEKRGGQYVLYKNRVRIRNYRRILDNPESLGIINSRLANYKNLLKRFYTMWLENVLNLITEKGDQQLYTALLVYPIGKGIDQSNVQWESFRNALTDRQNKNKLKRVKQEFIAYLIQNPSKDLFFNFVKATTSERFV